MSTGGNLRPCTANISACTDAGATLAPLLSGSILPRCHRQQEPMLIIYWTFQGI